MIIRTLTLGNPPEEFEAVAEFRAPKEGEYFFAEDGAVCHASSDITRNFIVLTPIKKKYKLQDHDYVKYHGARVPWRLAQNLPPSESLELAVGDWEPMHKVGYTLSEYFTLEFLDMDAEGLLRITDICHGATLAWRVKGLKDGWTL